MTSPAGSDRSPSGGEERERFERDTAEHEMTILRDDGLYRHLRFQQPGTSIYYYDLVTWPGHLVICGDMGDYHFARIRDMFEFFPGHAYGINPGYWAEKLRGPGSDTSRSFSREKFKALVQQWVSEAADELDEDAARDLRTAVSEQVLEREEADWGQDHARELLRDFEYNGLRIGDWWEWDLREHTPQFLWCCWAIVRGIERYRAATREPVAA